MFKPAIKALVGPSWQARARRASRLRWITKYGILRRYGIGLRENPRQNIPFLLWDPEVESHTYDIENLAELAAFVVEATGVSIQDAMGWVLEPQDEPWFNELWAQHVRWRFDARRRVRLANRHLWWTLVRAMKPRVVIETGSYNGIGSLVLLCAIERNRREGFDGELLSIDADAAAGSMVPAAMRSGWTLVHGMTTDALEPLLKQHKVDLLIHDTTHDYETQRFEFTMALAHRSDADRVVLLDSGGGQTMALEDICRERKGRYLKFTEVPKNHFYPARGTGVGVFTRGSDPAP